MRLEQSGAQPLPALGQSLHLAPARVPEAGGMALDGEHLRQMIDKAVLAVFGEDALAAQ